MEVLDKNQMLSIAEKTVSLAMKKGAMEAEAYIYEGEANNIGIELGQVNKSNQIIDRGVGVRVSVNKAVGFAYTNIINDQKAIESIVDNALSAAKASKPDQDWKELCVEGASAMPSVLSARFPTPSCRSFSLPVKYLPCPPGRVLADLK